MKGALVDIDHSEKGGQSYVDLYVSGKSRAVFHEAFDPYLYFDGEEPKADGIKRVERENLLWKVYAKTPADVPKLREALARRGRVFEHDIPYVQRFMIDRDIVPLRQYEWEQDGNKVVAKATEGEHALTRVALDIETYNPRGMPEAERDPIVMMSSHDGKSHVYTTRKIALPFVTSYKNEEAMLAAVNGLDYDVMYTYNGDNFDFPYIAKRMEVLGIEAGPGAGGAKIAIRSGMRGLKARIPGRIHIDAYRGMMFLALIGSLRLPRYTLDDVYKEFTGKEKLDIDAKYLWRIWDKGDRRELEELAEYSRQDAEAAFELGEHILPLYVAISQLINQMPFEVSRMTSSQVVESLLMRMAKRRGEISPNKPGEGEFQRRVMTSIKGAFVRSPEPGLHSDVAVMDFKGLYPSIIISYNIDPSTLNCGCCKDPHVSPLGQRFCKKKLGLIPEMLKRVTAARAKAKVELKKASGKEAKRLNAEQQALKIVANSTYGYMNFARARWYSHDCAEATTALSRQYIQEAAAEAEKRGFKVIYGDTDSVFLLRGGKSKDEVLKFLREYNASLPEPMELELQGFYPRGIFVTKRGGEAAKKRYALIREDGQVEIKGLEFVRRDWSGLAKKAQQQVIQKILEGDTEGAKKLIKERIAEVRKGTIPSDDYIIWTQLKQRIAGYASTGPHVRAAMRLAEAGEDVGKGSSIGYVVTQGAGSIGDRSYPYQKIGSRKPDPEYYINNQLLPAVMKIVAELGVTKDELLHGNKQSGLGAWS